MQIARARTRRSALLFTNHRALLTLPTTLQRVTHVDARVTVYRKYLCATKTVRHVGEISFNLEGLIGLIYRHGVQCHVQNSSVSGKYTINTRRQAASKELPYTG